jgi:hypothetical protein
MPAPLPTSPEGSTTTAPVSPAADKSTPFADMTPMLAAKTGVPVAADGLGPVSASAARTRRPRPLACTARARTRRRSARRVRSVRTSLLARRRPSSSRKWHLTRRVTAARAQSSAEECLQHVQRQVVTPRWHEDSQHGHASTRNRSAGTWHSRRYTRKGIRVRSVRMRIIRGEGIVSTRYVDASTTRPISYARLEDRCGMRRAHEV